MEILREQAIACVLLRNKGDLNKYIDYMTTDLWSSFNVVFSYVAFEDILKTDEDAVVFFMDKIYESISKTEDLNNIVFYSNYHTQAFEILKSELDTIFEFNYLEEISADSVII